VRIWSTDLKQTAPLKILRGHHAPVLTVLYSFDSKLLASSDVNGEVIIWDASDGDILRKFKAHNDLVQDVAFAADKTTLVTGSLDKHAKLWNINGPTLLMDIDTGVGVWSVDIVSDASIIAVACEDGTVRLLTKVVEPVKKGRK
jgi:WD40 repeat protein